jgi:hypothetical protein
MMMLASTVQFSRYGRYRRALPRIRKGACRSWKKRKDARSLRTQQRARPGRHRRHRSVPEDVLDWLERRA